MQTEAVIKRAKKALKFIRFPRWISAFNYLKPHQERDYHTRQPLLIIDFLFEHYICDLLVLPPSCYNFVFLKKGAAARLPLRLHQIIQGKRSLVLKGQMWHQPGVAAGLSRGVMCCDVGAEFRV